MSIYKGFLLTFISGYLLGSVFTLAHAEQSIKKDPTRPALSNINPSASSKAPKKPNWRLQAVTYSENQQLAIINGKSYQAGQWLNKEAKLSQIFPDAVVILVGNKTQTLSLRANKIKTEVNGAFN